MAKVTVEQLLKPQGDIDAALLFPGATLDKVRDDINGWIDRGYATLANVTPTITDEAIITSAIENWTYAKIYNDVHTRMAASPVKAGVSGEADETFDVAQIREFGIKAASYLAAYETIVADATNVTLVEPRRSRSLKNQFSW